MKFRVTFQLMIDPSKGDECFNKSFTVEVEEKKQALSAAEKKKDEFYDPQYGYLNKRCVFNYSVKEVD